MKIFFLIFFSILLLVSCKEPRICFNEPATLTLEFVNEQGENMITNKELVTSMFEFKKELGGNQNRSVSYDIDERDRIVLWGLSLEKGTQQYKFLSVMQSFAFVLNGKNYENCGGVYIAEVLFQDVEHTQMDDFIQVKLVRK